MVVSALSRYRGYNEPNESGQFRSCKGEEGGKSAGIDRERVYKGVYKERNESLGRRNVLREAERAHFASIEKNTP